MASERHLDNADVTRSYPKSSPLLLGVLGDLRDHGPVDGGEEFAAFLERTGLHPRNAIDHLIRMARAGYLDFKNLGNRHVNIKLAGLELVGRRPENPATPTTDGEA